MPGQVCRDGSAAGVLAALPEDPELSTATLQLTTIYNSNSKNLTTSSASKGTQSYMQAKHPYTKNNLKKMKKIRGMRM